MPWTEPFYETVLRAGRPLLGLVAAFDAKLARGLEGRRHAVRRLTDWASNHRDPGRPLVWLHAPSVGEALMAQAIIESLRAERPAAQIAFTFFSPSAARVSERVGADVADYLPWDLPRETGRVLDALRPSALAFVRTEAWPVLTREARRRGVPLALVNAALSSRSSRLRPAARSFLRHTYARLDAIGAISDEDAARFVALSVPRDRIHITGDARFDQVVRRIGRMDRNSPVLMRFAGSDPLMIAGSTWPEDEKRLIDAYARVRVDARLRLAIAPHEPTDRHIAALEHVLDARRLPHARLSRIEAASQPAAGITLIDRVGILADLYSCAAFAFVGGGFGRSGLHSVIEPAALGIPVLFGPRHGNAREAAELAGAGGGIIIRDAVELARCITSLLAEPTRSQAGAAAARFVAAHTGGAARNAGLILGLMS